MKNIQTYIRKNIAWLEGIFVLSIIAFVFVELAKIFKEVDWNRVGNGLAGQSIYELLGMLCFGLLAVCPMLIYDFSIVSFLPGKYSIKYIIKSGWITNTFTNIAGFGGLLGATLRANFYHENATKKQVVYAISKIALFLLAGLSFLCWVALAFLLLGKHEIHLYHYIIWLILGGLYFPSVLIFTRISNGEFFKDLSTKIESLLMIGSILDWAFASGFFLYVGHVLNVKVSILDLFILYIIGSVIGVISMVPGGLGSFDVFIILGLQYLGVSSSTGVIWLLFFRIFYYIIPFAIGIFLFMHGLAQKINVYYKSIPAQLIQKFAHGLVTVFMYLSGILMLIEAVAPGIPYYNRLTQTFYNYSLIFINQMTDVIFAFLLIAMARGINSKVKKAFIPTIIVLLIGIGNALLRFYTPTVAIYLTIVLISVILTRKELYREQLRYSLKKIFIDGGIFVVTFITYLIVGYLNFKRINVKQIPDLLIFPGQQVWFSGFMGLLIALLITLAIVVFFRSDIDPFKKVNYDREKIQAIVSQYGGNEVSHLAHLRDKNIYFYKVNGQDVLYFMYRRKNDKLIFMGEPVGNYDYLKSAITDLMNKADIYGYELVFYEINADLTMLLHDLGLDFIKTGEEGFVKLAEFSLAGKKRRAERALMNKFERENYQFEIVQPPFNHEFIEKLNDISNEWLDGQNEKGFSLGFFDEYYLNQAPIAIVRDADNEIIAFANLMPMQKDVLSIDLMRHKKDAPSGIMDLIFISLFRYGTKNGYQQFNLGMTPLANVGTSDFSFVEEKVAHYIYEFGYSFYGFQGLRAYKEKYVSVWIPKYTAYRKRKSVAITMYEVMMVVNREKKNRRNVPFFLKFIV